MTTIIAGRFQTQPEVDDTIAELQRAGFARERISTFYVNPAGRHATYPIGGDADKSQGAKESGKGVAVGAAAGAAVGVATTPVLGPLGPVTGGLLGAHVGGLVGGLSQMKERGDTGEHNEDPENATPLRKSGLMLAIDVGVHGGHEYEDRAINVLRSLGASDIERAEGTIVDGDWTDFDPMSTPALINSSPGQTHVGGTHQRT